MWPFKEKEKKTEEQIRIERQKWLDEGIEKSAKLRKLIIYNESGWREFIQLIDEYIQTVKKRKVATALDYADDKVIYELKLLDRDINTLEWVKQIPQQFINKIETELNKDKEKEESQ